MNDYFGKLLAKYEMRGWKSQDILWPEDEASHSSITEYRRVGDRWTWIIPLDNTGVDGPDTPDTVLEYSTFLLRKNSGYHLGHYISMAHKFSSLVLKYKYVNSHGVGFSSKFWPDFAGPRLERLSLIELFKIPPPSRPQPIEDVLNTAVDFDQRMTRLKLFNLRSDIAENGIELPSYDHEIPGWYAQWEKGKASQTGWSDPGEFWKSFMMPASDWQNCRLLFRRVIFHAGKHQHSKLGHLEVYKGGYVATSYLALISIENSTFVE